jgi:hypothetical protein
MTQASDPLEWTRKLGVAVSRGGSIVDARAAALAELEAMRARVTADTYAMQLLAAGPTDEDEAAEKQRLEQILFGAKDELQAIRTKLLGAFAELRT